jgi:sigma54-dependent transcription regulator
VGLALLSSLLSVGGLIAVGRTLAQANAARTEAEARQDALAGVPAMVAQMKAASERLDAASSRAAAASPSGPPATIEDIRHELDVLKLALAQHQPDGISALTGTTRDGFSEVADRLDRLSDQLNKAKAPAGAVSASPPASREAYPRHSS